MEVISRGLTFVPGTPERLKLGKMIKGVTGNAVKGRPSTSYLVLDNFIRVLPPTVATYQMYKLAFQDAAENAGKESPLGKPKVKKMPGFEYDADGLDNVIKYGAWLAGGDFDMNILPFVSRMDFSMVGIKNEGAVVRCRACPKKFYVHQYNSYDLGDLALLNDLDILVDVNLGDGLNQWSDYQGTCCYETNQLEVVSVVPVNDI